MDEGSIEGVKLVGSTDGDGVESSSVRFEVGAGVGFAIAIPAAVATTRRPVLTVNILW